MKKFMLIVATVLVILVLIVPAGCAVSQDKLTSGMTDSSYPPSAYPVDEDTFDRGGEVLTETDQERMIVRTGDMSLVVSDVIEARDEITELAVGLDGYVVSSRIWGEEQDMRGSISIRVPDSEFQSALSELRALAVRVTSESTNSQDVTEEYIDLNSRLANAEATEEQYLELLEKAEDVEDILSIYQRLSQVRQEIEQLKGRMQYLERTSSMSLISIYLEPEASGKPLVGTGWNAGEAFKSAIRGIVSFGQWLATVVIWLLIFSPVWGAIVGVIYWILRRRKRSKNA